MVLPLESPPPLNTGTFSDQCESDLQSPCQQPPQRSLWSLPETKKSLRYKIWNTFGTKLITTVYDPRKCFG